MAIVPSPRNKILPARGNFADLNSPTALAALADGEICYAIDEDRYYQVENGVLVAASSSAAQRLKIDNALETVAHDNTITGDGTLANPLSVVGGSGGTGRTVVTDNTLEGLGTSASPLSQAHYIAVSASGTIAFKFNGRGFSGNELNPDIYVVRGETYIFANTTNLHPLAIQSTSGPGGTQYDDGITNNGSLSGKLGWEVRMDAPSTLYYQCQTHPVMGGRIYVLDASGGGGVSSVGIAGDGNISVAGSPITSSGVINVGLEDTAVTAGDYTNPSITIDSKGRITAALSGSGSGTDAYWGVDGNDVLSPNSERSVSLVKTSNSPDAPVDLFGIKASDVGAGGSPLQRFKVDSNGDLFLGADLGSSGGTAVNLNADDFSTFYKGLSVDQVFEAQVGQNSDPSRILMDRDAHIHLDGGYVSIASKDDNTGLDTVPNVYHEKYRSTYTHVETNNTEKAFVVRVTDSSGQIVAPGENFSIQYNGNVETLGNYISKSADGVSSFSAGVDTTPQVKLEDGQSILQIDNNSIQIKYPNISDAQGNPLTNVHIARDRINIGHQINQTAVNGPVLSFAASGEILPYGTSGNVGDVLTSGGVGGAVRWEAPPMEAVADRNAVAPAAAGTDIILRDSSDNETLRLLATTGVVAFPGAGGLTFDSLSDADEVYLLRRTASSAIPGGALTLGYVNDDDPNNPFVAIAEIGARTNGNQSEVNLKNSSLLVHGPDTVFSTISLKVDSLDSKPKLELSSIDGAVTVDDSKIKVSNSSVNSELGSNYLAINGNRGTSGQVLVSGGDQGFAWADASGGGTATIPDNPELKGTVTIDSVLQDNGFRTKIDERAFYVTFKDAFNNEVNNAILDSEGLSLGPSVNSGSTNYAIKISQGGEIMTNGDDTGTDGQVLVSKGPGSPVQWADIAGGGATRIQDLTDYGLGQVVGPKVWKWIAGADLDSTEDQEGTIFTNNEISNWYLQASSVDANNIDRRSQLIDLFGQFSSVWVWFEGSSDTNPLWGSWQQASVIALSDSGNHRTIKITVDSIGPAVSPFPSNTPGQEVYVTFSNPGTTPPKKNATLKSGSILSYNESTSKFEIGQAGLLENGLHIGSIGDPGQDGSGYYVSISPSGAINLNSPSSDVSLQASDYEPALRLTKTIGLGNDQYRDETALHGAGTVSFFEIEGDSQTILSEYRSTGAVVRNSLGEVVANIPTIVGQKSQFVNGIIAGPTTDDPVFEANADGRLRITGGFMGQEFVFNNTPSDLDLFKRNIIVVQDGETVTRPVNAASGLTGLIRFEGNPLGWDDVYKFPGGTPETISVFPAIAPYYVMPDATGTSWQVLVGYPTQGFS